jgi:hypothetical protein
MGEEREPITFYMKRKAFHNGFGWGLGRLAIPLLNAQDDRRGPASAVGSQHEVTHKYNPLPRCLSPILLSFDLQKFHC